MFLSCPFLSTFVFKNIEIRIFGEQRRLWLKENVLKYIIINQLSIYSHIVTITIWQMSPNDFLHHLPLAAYVPQVTCSPECPTPSPMSFM